MKKEQTRILLASCVCIMYQGIARCYFLFFFEKIYISWRARGVFVFNLDKPTLSYNICIAPLLFLALTTIYPANLDVDARGFVPSLQIINLVHPHRFVIVR